MKAHITLFIVGVFFRLALTYFFPQMLINDSLEYHQFALAIVHNHNHLYASTYRLYGYPLFLSLIYGIFGTGDQIVWKIAQAILDSSVGVMIYYLGSWIFKSPRGGLIGMILYTFNFYTAGYVGARLTEVVTIFLIMLLFMLFYLFLRKKSILSIVGLSIVSGFIPQVRPGFLSFSIIVILLLVLFLLRAKDPAGAKIVRCLLSLLFLFYRLFIL